MDKKINKQKLFQALQAELKKNLDLAVAAAKNTYEGATHEDNKAENKYDTRSLEASYLAGAQAERVADLRETVAVIGSLTVKDFNEKSKIALTALVEISSQEKNSWVLLLPLGGGQSLRYEDNLIQVITPSSPLGRALIGKQLEDEVQVNDRRYTVSDLL